MSQEFSYTTISLVVKESPTLTCKLTLHAYKDGNHVPLGSQIMDWIDILNLMNVYIMQLYLSPHKFV